MNPKQYRILVIDDNRAIHQDFRKILAADNSVAALESIESDLFGDTRKLEDVISFEVDSAYQGKEGLEKVISANEAGQPYSMAFVDIRMPPGWDGIETIEHIWKADPDFQVVICSAYSDHSWSEISQRLGNSSQMLILKKPFENIEIIQMAHAMSQKRTLQSIEKRLAAIDNNMQQYQHLGNERDKELQQTREELGELRSRFSVFQELAGHFDNNYSIPLQDIKDSAQTLKHSFSEIDQLIQQYRALFHQNALPDNIKFSEQLAQSEKAIDLEYLRERIPAASQRIDDAVARLTEHIKAMQELAELAHVSG